MLGFDLCLWTKQYVLATAHDTFWGGTTIKDLIHLPKDLLADEKHTHFNGEKAYIATTVAEDCVTIVLSADEEQLTLAYGQFKKEAQQLAPDYQLKQSILMAGQPLNWLGKHSLLPFSLSSVFFMLSLPSARIASVSKHFYPPLLSKFGTFITLRHSMIYEFGGNSTLLVLHFSLS